MRVHHTRPIGLAAVWALGVLLSGCASGPPPETTADLTRAHTLIAEAERSGAQEYAPADLQKARDEAQQADQLAGHGNAQQADRLANEATVDARFATARASNGKAQHDLKDQQRTLETLRSEEGRQMDAPPSGTSPSGPPTSTGARQPNQLQAVPPPPSTVNPPDSSN